MDFHNFYLILFSENIPLVGLYYLHCKNEKIHQKDQVAI